MRSKKSSAQLGSSSQHVDAQTSRGDIQINEEDSDDQTLMGDIETMEEDIQPKEEVSSVKRPADSSKQPSQASQEPDDTVDVLYKIVCSDHYEYSVTGNVYFRYLIPPERRSTGWFTIVAFHWQDVRAEFEGVYHPAIGLLDDLKPIDGQFKGGSGGIQRVELSMWNYADKGPYLNPKHTVYDDNGNRIMLAIMITSTGSAVKLYGKKIREGDNESEVWLSKDERKRLRLRS